MTEEPSHYFGTKMITDFTAVKSYVLSFQMEARQQQLI